MRYKGIIFDFNGVLLWDTPLQSESWCRYAEHLRGKRFSEQEVAEHVIGRDNRYILHYLTGRVINGQELEIHTDHKETLYRNLCLEQGPNFQLSPGAPQLLDELTARGVRRAIASSAGKENFLFYFLHLDLSRWFDFDDVIYDDDRIATKPAPDAYLKAADRLGLPPAACVAVEDSLHGIQAARSAGMGYIVALGEAEQHPRLLQIEGVDYTVETLNQVPVRFLYG